jgi:hypothetical protein
LVWRLPVSVSVLMQFGKSRFPESGEPRTTLNKYGQY